MTAPVPDENIMRHNVPNGRLSLLIQKKIDLELITHIFKQNDVGFFAALFAATVILVGLYPGHHPKILTAWYIVIWMVTLLRFLLVKMFLYSIFPEVNISLWKGLFITGALLSGMCWGFLCSYLLPYDNLMQLTLTLFIIAGMTAGAVPMLSGILWASYAYLITSLVPLIATLFWADGSEFVLFGISLLVYLLYLILISINTHTIITNTLGLQYENILLLENLSNAKRALEETNVKLDHAAKHDPLTNHANRSLFEMSFSSAILRVQQEHKGLALLYLDIDKFKEVNDAYGHHVGDLLLQKIVERIIRKVPEKSITSRLGGDEITIIIENVDNPDQVAELAKNICASLAKPFDIQDYNIFITASIGISMFPIDGRDTDMLLRNADKAMYFAKERGGNNYHFNTDISAIKNSFITFS